MSILLASTDFWEDMEVWSSALQEAMPEMDVNNERIINNWNLRIDKIQ